VSLLAVLIDKATALSHVCHGNDEGGPDHEGGDPGACQLREHLQRYIEERGWCFVEAWAPCR
jgi:hypothetical protein